MSWRSLQDLGALKAQLKASGQQRLQQEAQAQAQAVQAEREHHLFSLSVGPVQPVARHPQRADPPPTPPPQPRARQPDAQAVLRSSLSDEFEAALPIEIDDQPSYAQPSVGADVLRKLRQGYWRVEAQLDLHGLRRDGAREQLSWFVREASQRGLRCVRIIHGQGHGHGSVGREPVLKNKVRHWLIQKKEVAAFVQAPASQGGQGALVVLLNR